LQSIGDNVELRVSRAERTDCSTLRTREEGIAMRTTKLIAAAVLPGLIATPVAAANPAASLSLSGSAAGQEAAPAPVPAAVPASAGFLSGPILLGGLALVLVVVGAVALGSNHNDSTPASA
jgi:hypothetical protein